MLAASLAIATLTSSQPLLEPDWSVNENRTFIWHGEPYLPVGAKIAGTVSLVEQAAEAGLQDLVVELPADGTGWAPVLAALEEAEMRYFIEIASLGPSLEGFAIEPEGYRIGPFSDTYEVNVEIEGATSAFLVLANARDGRVRESRSEPLIDGRLVTTVEPPSGLESVLLIYPRVEGLSTIDYWEGFDAHRDSLLASVRRNALGEGLRGFINPLGQVAAFPSPDTQFIPDSPIFRLEFKSLLQERYAAVDTALRAWSVGANSVTNFDQLARLVPLWSEFRGVSSVWDPASQRLYDVDRERSLMWEDVRRALRQASARRYRALALALKEETGVPVLQTWRGWTGPYEDGGTGLDGIAYRASGVSIGELAGDAGRPISTAVRYPGGAVALGTELELPNLEATLLDEGEIVSELESMGSRGFFFRAETAEDFDRISELAFFRGADTSAAQWDVTPLFFPESALSVATPRRLVGGTWWLPSPGAGERIDFGDGLLGYRYAGADQYVVLWSESGERRLRLNMPDAENVAVQNLAIVDEEPRVRRDSVDVTVTDLPVVLRGTSQIPVPEEAMEATKEMMERMVGLAEAVDGSFAGARFMYQDTMRSYERNPAAVYMEVRNQLRGLAGSYGPFHWIEAELIDGEQHNFSEKVQEPGLGLGQALRLLSRIQDSEEKFYAEYEVEYKENGTHDVWVAGRIPSSALDDISLIVGSQVVSPQGPGAFPYKPGYAWYRFNPLVLPSADFTLRVEVGAANGTDLAIDAIVLSPHGFQPDGALPPTNWLTLPGN